MDIIIQHLISHSLCVYQSLQTRDSLQDTHASTAKSVVCPHVIVYMMAYAMLGAAMVMAVYLLFIKKTAATTQELDITDNLVYVGMSFVTLGMLMGALWAKEAWGHYWSWDPKETWAAITWLSYLVYIHYRQYKPMRPKPALVMLIVCFCLLQMCWWGINYLPSAQGVSVHTYSLD